MKNEEMIRKGFEDHQARFRSVWMPGIEDGAEAKLIGELEWSKNGEGRENVIRFLGTEDMLIVSGNYGVAVYMTDGNHAIGWWADTDIGYFWEKCKASKHDLGRIGAKVPLDVLVHHIALKMAVADLDV